MLSPDISSSNDNTILNSTQSSPASEYSPSIGLISSRAPQQRYDHNSETSSSSSSSSPSPRNPQLTTGYVHSTFRQNPHEQLTAYPNQQIQHPNEQTQHSNHYNQYYNPQTQRLSRKLSPSHFQDYERQQDLNQQSDETEYELKGDSYTNVVSAASNHGINPYPAPPISRPWAQVAPSDNIHQQQPPPQSQTWQEHQEKPNQNNVTIIAGEPINIRYRLAQRRKFGIIMAVVMVAIIVTIIAVKLSHNNNNNDNNEGTSSNNQSSPIIVGTGSSTYASSSGVKSTTTFTPATPTISSSNISPTTTAQPEPVVTTPPMAPLPPSGQCPLGYCAQQTQQCDDTCSADGAYKQCIASCSDQPLCVLQIFQMNNTPLYNAKDSSRKGRDMFVTQDIKRGACVISEWPILFVNSDILLAVVAINSMSKENKNYLSVLHNIYSESKIPKEFGIIKTNALPLGEHAKDAAVYRIISRINHSCAPNVHHTWSPDKEMEYIHAIGDIPAGTEILTSYISALETRVARQKELRANFRFTCQFRLCTAESNEEYDNIRSLHLSIFVTIVVCASFSLRKSIGHVRETLALFKKGNIWGKTAFYYDGFQIIVMSPITS
ncbi:hypothetical protein BGZ49_009694 [Haplosporangium sp. Z 27]|nr:hypothetical protein BGZ49_009694 [Haplosporangium sp. Z 27]